MRKQLGHTLVQLIVVLVVIAVVIGWIMNIVKLFWAMTDPITGLFIMRIVGILVAPLGAIIGYL